MQLCSFCSSSWHKIFLLWISHQSTLMFWDLRAQKQPSQSSEQQKVDQKKSSVPDTFKHLDRTWKPLFRVSVRIHTLSKLCQNCFSLKISVNSKVYFLSVVQSCQHKQCCCHISDCCFALFWTTISFFVVAFWYFCDLHANSWEYIWSHISQLHTKRSRSCSIIHCQNTLQQWAVALLPSDCSR